jgi:hypothetical protein
VSDDDWLILVLPQCFRSMLLHVFVASTFDQSKHVSASPNIDTFSSLALSPISWHFEKLSVGLIPWQSFTHWVCVAVCESLFRSRTCLFFSMRAMLAIRLLPCIGAILLSLSASLFVFTVYGPSLVLPSTVPSELQPIAWFVTSLLDAFLGAPWRLCCPGCLLEVI